MTKEEGGYFVLLFFSIMLFAWLTHIFTCFSEGMWGMLIAGAIMFPIGILHGIYLWFT